MVTRSVTNNRSTKTGADGSAFCAPYDTTEDRAQSGRLPPTTLADFLLRRSCFLKAVGRVERRSGFRNSV